ncbi:hypothetical protein AVEN_85482-1 [Araneus ventricosus]|uniref:Uncharacterized protein n=1 Tax=Araneus ventricosus TaxID=182803 RepID=A0A4Y2PNL9_ARAVE|nr:hypothetical protein AVEN_85482-1 [Araneus ventricosus]
MGGVPLCRRPDSSNVKLTSGVVSGFTPVNSAREEFRCIRENMTNCLATDSETLRTFAHAPGGVIVLKIGGKVKNEGRCLHLTELDLTKTPEMRSYDSLSDTPFLCKIVQKW